jgi:hypothetical protein
MIGDRNANACAVFRRRDHPTNTLRSSSVNTTGPAFGLATNQDYPVSTNCRLKTLALKTPPHIVRDSIGHADIDVTSPWSRNEPRWSGWTSA